MSPLKYGKNNSFSGTNHNHINSISHSFVLLQSQPLFYNNNILHIAILESAMSHSNYCSSKFLEPFVSLKIWQKWFFLTKNNHKNSISHSFVLVRSQPLFENDNIYCLNQYFNRKWLMIDVVLPITTAFCFPQKYISKMRFLVKSQKSSQ